MYSRKKIEFLGVHAIALAIAWSTSVSGWSQERQGEVRPAAGEPSRQGAAGSNQRQNAAGENQQRNNNTIPGNDRRSPPNDQRNRNDTGTFQPVPTEDSAGIPLREVERNSVGLVRVSRLIGMRINNLQGENIGQLRDLVMEGATGVIRYAVVTYHDQLGVGNQLFAVPFEAFRSQQNDSSRNGYVLILDVNADMLQGAVGFDDNQWPNFDDENFGQDLNRRYRLRVPLRNDPDTIDDRANSGAGRQNRDRNDGGNPASRNSNRNAPNAGGGRDR